MTPTLEAIVGMREAQMTVVTDLGIGAVELRVPDTDIALVLSPAATLELILKLIGALHRLQGRGP